MRKLPSSQNGASSAGMTALPQASPSSSAARSSTLGMSVPTVEISPDFLTTQKPQDTSESALQARMLQGFAAALVQSGRAEWHKITLSNDGRVGIALFLPLGKWSISEDGKTLLPR